MIIEVGSSVLQHAEGGYSRFRHDSDVGARAVAGRLQNIGSNALQNALDRPEHFDGLRSYLEIKPEGMRGSTVAFDGRDVPWQLVRMDLSVGVASRSSRLFVHPGDNPDCPLRAQVKHLKKFRRLHGNDHARAIVDRTGAEIPRVEMSGDHHDLLRMFAALQIGDHVVACTVGQLLWSEREMHTGSALNR